MGEILLKILTKKFDNATIEKPVVARPQSGLQH
jgi:hypothetical protein